MLEFEELFELEFDELLDEEFELEFEELLDELFEELFDELLDDELELELPATRVRSCLSATAALVSFSSTSSGTGAD
ncbi:MAG: hypothetical protein AB7O71_25555 [Hyphomicrobiaceae bacterium]